MSPAELLRKAFSTIADWSELRFAMVEYINNRIKPEWKDDPDTEKAWDLLLDQYKKLPISEMADVYLGLVWFDWNKDQDLYDFLAGLVVQKTYAKGHGSKAYNVWSLLHHHARPEIVELQKTCDALRKYHSGGRRRKIRKEEVPFVPPGLFISLEVWQSIVQLAKFEESEYLNKQKAA